MRDALRAVGAVIGAAAVLAGAAGLFRGWLTRVEVFALGVGLVLIAVVALTSSGKPAPHEDGDRGEQNW